MELSDFKKQKDFLFCIDSDGCVIDSMTWKHTDCFGPLFVTYWGLEDISKLALELWNHINLYSLTRGVNRFKGVVLTLKSLKEKGLYAEDFSKLTEWTLISPSLSNNALMEALQIGKSPQLEIALEWSKAVNQGIANTYRTPHAFTAAKAVLPLLKKHGDIAVVSSANRKAVIDEWSSTGVIEYPSLLCTQETGSKEHCLSALIKKGYSANQVIMIGDAPGDMEAAQRAGVWYYPIIPGQEGSSWANLWKSIGTPLLTKSFSPLLQEKFNEQLIHALS